MRRLAFVTGTVLFAAAMALAGACADKDEGTKKGVGGFDAAFNVADLLDAGALEKKGGFHYDGGLYVDPGGRDGVLVTQAVATMAPINGSRIEGTIRLIESEDGVRAGLDLKGMTYMTKYTVRVHMLGNCSSDDGASTGPGFAFDDSSLNPSNPASAGLMGEINGDINGTAKGEAPIPGPAIRGPWTIVGRSLVIHEAADGLGDSMGKRIACGVIGIYADVLAPLNTGDH